LAFEYQGEQHYSDSFSMGAQWKYVQRDQEKRIVCEQNGITLIEVPYWWDFQKESLMATIYQTNPHLIQYQGNAKPIPTEPPGGFPTTPNEFQSDRG